VNVLVCVKRVPATGGRITLSADELEIDARFLGFTVSPHEECAVEEAVRLIEAHGGATVVLTLGPDAAVEQLRDAMALGIDRAIHLVTDGSEWDAQATASAIADAVTAQRAAGVDFDLLLFGNEAADTGDFQVGIRVARALGLPCVTGVKGLRIEDGAALAERDAGGGREVLEVPLPAVLTVKEGINLPRYPSVPGRLKAKAKPVERTSPSPAAGGLQKIRLRLPKERDSALERLGTGAEAAPRIVEVLRSLGLVP
jgi:electron transfer flavoprotein beta subunit